MALIGSIGEFDPKRQSWEVYCERLEQFYEANDIKDKDKRRATLLSSVGHSTYCVIRNLVSPDLPKDKPYQELMTLLSNHYDPKPRETVQRYKFNSRCRAPNESVMEYVKELRSLLQGCNYGSTVEQMLRDRLVSGINDDHIQSKLLAEANLTFDRAMLIAVTAEMENKNARDDQNPSAPATCLKLNKGTFRSGSVRHHPYRGQPNPIEYNFKQEDWHACDKGGHEPRARRNRREPQGHFNRGRNVENQPRTRDGSRQVPGQQDSAEAPFSVQSMGVGTIHNRGDVLSGPFNFHNVNIQ